MLVAFGISARSPNIRWLIGTLTLVKTLDIVILDVILTWGAFYYVAISLLDLTVILLVIYRQATANWVAAREWGILSKIAHYSSKYYQFTSNEMSIIGILCLSIIINLFSAIEQGIRHYTDFNPMFIYDTFPYLKFALSGLLLMALISVAIDAAKNYYQDRQSFR